MDDLTQQYRRLKKCADQYEWWSKKQVTRCDRCPACVDRKTLLTEYHRLAALYPHMVPTEAPPEVNEAIGKATRSRVADAAKARR